MRVENECSELVRFELMFNSKPASTGRLAIRVAEEFVEVHAKQHNG